MFILDLGLTYKCWQRMRQQGWHSAGRDTVGQYKLQQPLRAVSKWMQSLQAAKRKAAEASTTLTEAERAFETCGMRYTQLKNSNQLYVQ